ncbi:MAG: hypothetical protein HQM10_07875 [Candidatus Riflebacteria bacterium]|nr:hypothetical protein [Candidatus Riflebacteria bacterium]
MKKYALCLLFALAVSPSDAELKPASNITGPARSQMEADKQWSSVIEMLGKENLSKVAYEKMIALVDQLVDAEANDADGLNVAMHASALGNLAMLEHIDLRSHSLLLQKHPRTGLNVLHFAGQAKGNKGSAIINWFFKKYPSEALNLVNTRALNSNGKGNGHTVVMEAVFTKRIDTVNTLLALASNGIQIDFSTPAITGWGPKTIAEREKLSVAALLPDCDVPADKRVAWGIEQDRIYLEAISDKELYETEKNGILFLKLLSEGKVSESLQMVADSKVSINGRYGRMQGTALGTVTTPSSNRTAEEVAQQTKLVLEAGADPRVAEGSLMFVHGAFRSAVFGFTGALKHIMDKVEKDHGKNGLVNLLNTSGPENGVTMGLDAAWRRRADVLKLWLDRGGNPSITSFAGENILEAIEEWQTESKNNTAITPPPQDLIDQIQKKLFK